MTLLSITLLTLSALAAPPDPASLIALNDEAQDLIGRCQSEGHSCGATDDELGRAFLISAVSSAVRGELSLTAAANARYLAPGVVDPWTDLLPTPESAEADAWVKAWTLPTSANDTSPARPSLDIGFSAPATIITPSVHGKFGLEDPGLSLSGRAALPLPFLLFQWETSLTNRTTILSPNVFNVYSIEDRIVQMGVGLGFLSRLHSGVELRYSLTGGAMVSGIPMHEREVFESFGVGIDQGRQGFYHRHALETVAALNRRRTLGACLGGTLDTMTTWQLPQNHFLISRNTYIEGRIPGAIGHIRASYELGLRVRPVESPWLVDLRSEVRYRVNEPDAVPERPAHDYGGRVAIEYTPRRGE